MRGYLKNDTFFGLIALKSKILALNGWAADGVYRSADGGYNCWVSLCTKVKYCKSVQWADNRWAMIETWTSAAALEQHSKSAHVKAFQAAQKGNVEAVIKKYVKQ